MTLLVVVIAFSLFFDFTNGFHDTANAVATSVSTRALSPRLAVLIASVANLAGAFVTTAVAKTVGSGIVDTALISNQALLAAVLGAIVWNLLTWRLGIPSSSSHALIGGLLGASAVAAGFGAWQTGGIEGKVLLPLFSSPIIGFGIGFGLMVVIFQVFRRAHPKTMNDRFRRLQVLSAAFMGRLDYFRPA